MPVKIEYVHDAGHGWLRVPLADFPDARDFGTGFGYDDGDFVFLEEDCEAGLFMDAHAAQITITDVFWSPRHLRALACSHKHRWCSCADVNN